MHTRVAHAPYTLSLTHSSLCVCVCSLSLSLSVSLLVLTHQVGRDVLKRLPGSWPLAQGHPLDQVLDLLALDTLVNEVVNAPLVCKAKHMECRMSVRQASRVGEVCSQAGRSPSSSSLSSESELPSVAWAGSGSVKYAFLTQPLKPKYSTLRYATPLSLEASSTQRTSTSSGSRAAGEKNAERCDESVAITSNMTDFTK